MVWSIERIETFLLIAAIVAMLADRIRFPYTAGLVLAGVALAYTNIVPDDLSLTKDLIFRLFLPPLVFEAAFCIPWPDLRRNLAPVLTLATVGVLLSAGLTALGMRYLAGWGWAAAALFGALIAATDPVSVIAVFKEAKVEGRLRLLVESESLLNDGTAAVLFGIVLAAVQGGSVTAAGVLSSLCLSVFGGILCGLLIGWAALLLAGRTEDPLVETTFTTVAAYGSFLLAEHFGMSGVLATLTTGLLLGNVGSLGALSDAGRPAVFGFWEYAAFVVNSLIFLLIGVREAREHFAHVAAALVAAIVLVTLSRAFAVYPLCALFAHSKQRIPLREQHILVWGGLRGALALALVLGLPPDLPQRGAITSVAFGVVAFSIIVQGLTMPPLLRFLRILAPRGTESSKVAGTQDLGHGL